MPLSESEELKLNPLFKAVFDQVSERINQIVTDENNHRFYTALLAGGNTMASSVVSVCEGVKKAWAGGDEVKALALTKLFTLLMLSQCYRWLDAKGSNQHKPTGALQSAVSNVLHLFGDDSEEAIKDFFNIDIQFKYDLEYRSHMVHLGSLLLAKASEACGHRSIDWSKVSFPVKSMEPLTRSGAIIDSMTIGNPNDIKALWYCHATGIQAMVNYHEEQARS